MAHFGSARLQREDAHLFRRANQERLLSDQTPVMRRDLKKNNKKEQVGAWGEAGTGLVPHSAARD